MKGKIMLCRCEDVTLKDVRHSIELGYAHIEEVKRYTGFGTGPCQGKECTSLIAMVIAVRQALDYDSTMRAILVCLIGFPIACMILGLSILAVGPWPV